MPEISAAKRVKKNDEEIDQDNKKRLIVVIENCSLESAKVTTYFHSYIYMLLLFFIYIYICYSSFPVESLE